MTITSIAYEDLRQAADFLRAYSTAIETTLYMNMSVAVASETIAEADRLAEALDEFADELDTIYPPENVEIEVE